MPCATSLVERHLAVEDAQRILLEAHLAVGAQRVLVAARGRRAASRRTRAGTSACPTEFSAPSCCSSPNDARKSTSSRMISTSAFGCRGADALGAPLVELAVAAGLRAVVAEHRAHVPQPVDAAGLREPVLDQRAHDARRALGPQRQRAALLVGERVHLLGHDVGRLADAAQEQLRRLEDRRADLPVAVARRRRLARAVLERLPRRHVASGRMSCVPRGTWNFIVFPGLRSPQRAYTICPITMPVASARKSYVARDAPRHVHLPQLVQRCPVANPG